MRTQLQRARASVQPLISRYLLVTLALLGTLLVLQLPLPLPAARRAVVAAGFVLLTAGSLIRLRVPARALEWVLAVMVTLAVAATSLGAVFSGSGLTAPAFALRTLLACVLCALVRRRFALPVVALMVLALLLVSLTTPAMTLPAAVGLVERVVVHLLVLTSGAAGGLVISEMVARHMRAADEREHRFRSLLGIAADAY